MWIAGPHLKSGGEAILRHAGIRLANISISRALYPLKYPPIRTLVNQPDQDFLSHKLLFHNFSSFSHRPVLGVFAIFSAHWVILTRNYFLGLTRLGSGIFSRTASTFFFNSSGEKTFFEVGQIDPVCINKVIKTTDYVIQEFSNSLHLHSHDFNKIPKNSLKISSLVSDTRLNIDFRYTSKEFQPPRK